jgi:hypothetical protein
MTNYNTVEAGRPYVVSVWAAAGTPLSAKLTLTLTAAFVTNGGEQIATIAAEQKPLTSGAWLPLVSRGIAPEGAKRLYVILEASGKSGEVYWDDAYAGAETAGP